MFHTFLRPIQRQKRTARSFRLGLIGALLGIALPLSACSQGNGDSLSERRAIAQSQAIASDFLQTELALSPETASRLGLEQTLGPATSFALDNHSQAGFERRRLVRIELLQRLRQRPRLPDEHPLIDDLAIAERALLDLISLEQLGYGRFNYQTMRPYAIDPYSGIWIEGPNLLAFRQSITTVEQATAFVTRLQSLSAALQDTRRRVIADQMAGLRIPLSLSAELRDRLDQMADLETGSLDEISAVFDLLTLDVPDLELEDRAAFVAVVDEEVAQNLRPAYRALIETLSEAAGSSSDRLGVWAQPLGQDLFEGILKAATGEPISIERLHERHLEDAATLREQIDRALQPPPIEEGAEPTAEPVVPDTFAERLTWFEAFYAADPLPAATIEEVAADILLPLEALAPRSEWAEIAEAPSFDFQTLALHAFDTFWQSEPYAAWWTAARTDQQPLRALLEYPGIVDGWRLYIWNAETNNGRPPVTPVDRVARRSIDLIQASLAATDTGLHLERWTHVEAVAYVAEMTALDPAIAEQLVLRIAARPGHQTAVRVALHRLEALSERAKAVLGAEYSEAEFQRTLILEGPRPLDMIEKDIEAWYGERLAN
ncbi:MAG: DUF885 family protein [Henriciella sp.]